MSVKLFLVGRPGCGKSRTTRHIGNFIKTNGWDWSIYDFKDYDILYEMAQQDDSGEKFYLYEDGSFDVKDASKLDEALHILEKKVAEYDRNIDIHQSTTNQLIIIEMARGDYDDTFKKLSQDFLQDAYFLLIDAEFEKCKQRIKKRVASPEPDNHNVSNFVMETYYRNQHPLTIEHLLPRFKLLSNNNEWDDFTQNLEPLILTILKRTH